MLIHYLKLSWKVFHRRKFFTFVSLFGISFTLAVLLVVTALIDHVFAEHAPETNLDRRVGVYFLSAKGESSSRSGFPGWKFLDRHVRDLPGAESTTIFQVQRRVVAFEEGRKHRLWIKRTDAPFFDVMEFEFLAGGPYDEGDVANARMVAVINDTTAKNFFGSPGEAMGETIEVGQQRLRVKGVVPDVPFIRIAPFADIWAPTTTSPSATFLDEETTGTSMALVLAKDRSDIPLMKQEFEARVASAPVMDPEVPNINSSLDTLFNSVARDFFQVGDATRLRSILVVLALLFMGLPAINLINMNLSRIMERASEIGVRKSFGARSRTLVGQFVVENVLLTMLGGAVGLVLSSVALMVLNRSGLIPYAQLSLNFRIFGYGLVLAVVFGVISGVWPAWRMSRMHPVYALKGADR